MIKPTILVVDDNKFDRGLLSKALHLKGGFQIFEAENGAECLEIINYRKIDLVLLDYMMPDMDGQQALAKIRERFNAIELPVVMVTAKTDASDIINCLLNGANDYITKPVQFDVAVTRIATHLKLSVLSNQMAKICEWEALDAMIATYNHEINNPLTIAFGLLESAVFQEEIQKTKIRNSLNRIADITKKIREVSDKKDYEYRKYSETTKMISIK